MQPLQAFLTFYLGHLASDFTLQTSGMIAHKKAGRGLGYFQHGAAHYVAIVAVIAVTAPSCLLQLRLQGILLGLTGVHLLIDWMKIRLTARRFKDGALFFLVDQALHAVTVGVAALWYTGASLGAPFALFRELAVYRDEILAVAVVYVASVFASGYLIRYITRPLLGNIHAVGGESREELQNAGLYIGWLERILVLTAVILRSPATIGLIFAAKSIVRYPELKTARFAEYFLIGTFLSILLAFFGGIILLKVLYGAVHLAS